jgi:uncharacterized membrane protein YtjA (UPF0391 family)
MNLIDQNSGNVILDTQLQADEERRSKDMLYWAAVFLVIALIAAWLGFAGVAVAAAGAAKILFYIFLAIFLVTLIMGLGRRGTRV